MVEVLVFVVLEVRGAVVVLAALVGAGGAGAGWGLFDWIFMRRYLLFGRWMGCLWWMGERK